MVTQKKIKDALEKGRVWLKSKQNTDGSYGQWGLGSTCLALMALVNCQVPVSDLSLERAISHILNNSPENDSYFHALSVIALAKTEQKTPEIANRIKRDTDWLIESQCRVSEHTFSYGGWGNSGNAELINATNTQFAILALHSAHEWGLPIPDKTWQQGISWYQRNYDINQDGSYFCSLVQNYHSNDHQNDEVIDAITLGSLLSLKIMKRLVSDPKIKFQSQKLIDETLSWLYPNYNIDLLPKVSDSWQYLYLFNLQAACSFEPYYPYLGIHKWDDDLSEYLISNQKPMGNWASPSDKKSTEIVYTSFALLSLVTCLEGSLVDFTKNCWEKDEPNQMDHRKSEGEVLNSISDDMAKVISYKILC